MSSVFETYDMACPKCGSDEEITVEVTKLVVLVPEGTDDASLYNDQEWDYESFCQCRGCDFEGHVADFSNISVQRRCIMGAVQANLED